MHSIEKAEVKDLIIITMLDMFVVLVSNILAFFIRFNKIYVWSGDTYVFSNIFCIMIIGTILSNFFSSNYRDFMTRGYLVEFVEVLKHNFLFLLIVSSLIYIFRLEKEYSRLVLAYLLSINTVLDYIVHIILKKIFPQAVKSSKNAERVVLVLNKDSNDNQEQTIDECIGRDSVLVKKYIIEDEDESKFSEYIKDIIVDKVYISCDNLSKKLFLEITKACMQKGIECVYDLRHYDIGGIPWRIISRGNIPLLVVETKNFDYRKRAIKKLMDIVGGLIGSILTSVLFPFIAIAIKLDSKGPVIFKQERVGKNGRKFMMYKFRSMCVDAESKKDSLVEKNEMNGLMFKIDNDPRVTRVGRFLRKTSLDELPQFYNVLLGDMSLIGTRPPTVEEYNAYSLYYSKRLCIAPGITGLWQVSGRSDIKDFDEVVKLDFEYIDNWSLTFDIKILLYTVRAVLMRKGAK